MSGLTATQLAEQLSLSKGRISQLVKSGQLDGCFEGAGRSRRFDLAKAAAKLKHVLDPGQMLGNGSDTKKQITAALTGAVAQDQNPTGAMVLPKADVSRYELARIQNAEEDLRRKRRESAAAEGTMVLVAEVQQQISKVVSQEIAEFEAVMREAAAVVADKFELDARMVRQVLIEEWRSHRKNRRDTLKDMASEAVLSEAERKANI
ncbi:MAG: hypothetical protein ABJL67_13420 [Sulfitobacter sp.]